MARYTSVTYYGTEVSRGDYDSLYDNVDEIFCEDSDATETVILLCGAEQLVFEAAAALHSYVTALFPEIRSSAYEGLDNLFLPTAHTLRGISSIKDVVPENVFRVFHYDHSRRMKQYFFIQASSLSLVLSSSPNGSVHFILCSAEASWRSWLEGTRGMMDHFWYASRCVWAESCVLHQTARCEVVMSELVRMKLTALIEKQSADYEAENEKITSAAKKIKKSRISSEEKIDKLIKDIAACDDAKIWHTLICGARKAQLDYFAEQVKALRIQSRWENETVGMLDSQMRVFCARVSAFIVDRACDISEGLLEYSDSYSVVDIEALVNFGPAVSSVMLLQSNRLPHPLDLACTHRPLPPGTTVGDQTRGPLHSDNEKDDPTTPSNVAAVALQKQAVTTTSIRAKHKEATKRNTVTKHHDKQTADRNYIMQVYDSLTLIRDLCQYLTVGTSLLKHGRNGKPHVRKFWLVITAKTFVGGTQIHTTKTASCTLNWIDTTDTASQKKALDLGQVRTIILGPYSKVFQGKHGYAPTSPEFHRCFTLNTPDRSLDVVANNVNDFEAWILVLSHLMNIRPVWGQPLDISRDEKYVELSPEERLDCSNGHIFPTVYCHLRDLFQKSRDEVSELLELFDGNVQEVFTAVGGIHLPCINEEGALWVTKGEIRFHATSFQLDIVRVCCVWSLLNKKKLIFDPHFCHAINLN